MKNSFILMTLLLLMISSCGRDNSKISRIFDFEDILTSDQEKELDVLISKYHKKTSNEILILTSKDLEFYENAVQYAQFFGKEQGVFNTGKNNGLVIFVSDSLKLTSLATGYESEQSLKDEISKRIVDSIMIPFFREDKYFKGLKAGVKESIKNWN